MNIREIHIEGFGSIVKPLVFKFSDFGRELIIVSGQNGHGKSTLFGALVWALYGSYTKDVKDIQTWPELAGVSNGTRVGVTYYDKKEDLYEVYRHVDYKGETKGYKGANKLMVFVNGQMADARYKRDAQDLINNSVGMSHTVFMQTVFFGQNLTRILNNDKAANQKLFEEILSVDWVDGYEAKAREVRDGIKQAITDLNFQATKSDYELAQANLQNAATRLEDFEQNKQKNIARTNDQINEQKQLAKQAKEEAQQFRQKSDITENEKELQQLKDELRGYEETGEYEKLYGAVQDAYANLPSLADEKEKVRKKYADLADRAEWNFKEFQNNQSNEINYLESEIERLSSLIAQMSESVVRHEANLFKYNPEILSDYRKRKKEKLDHISHIENGEAVCETCGQELPEDEVKSKLASLYDQIKSLESSIKDFETKSTEANHEYTSTKIQLEEKTADLETLKKQLAEVEDHVRKARIKADAEITGIKAKVVEDIEKLEGLEALQASKGREAIEAAEAALKEFQDKVQELKTKESELVASIRIKKDWAVRAKELDQQVLRINKKIKSLYAALEAEEQTTLSVDLPGLNKTYDKAKELLAEAEKELTRLEKDLETATWVIRNIFGINGIKPNLLQSAMGLLNLCIRKYSHKFGYSIEFGINLEGRSKDFTAKVSYIGKTGETFTKNYEEFSGGEKQRIILAIAFGMGDFVESANDCNIVVQDEVFESLDDEGREMVFDLLEEKSKEKTVFAITHILNNERGHKVVKVFKGVNGTVLK